MSDEDSSQQSSVARFAKIAAIASWPAGIFLGLVLSSGQDAAGAPLGFAIGVVIAAVASAFFGVVVWFCRSNTRRLWVLQYRRYLISFVAVAGVVLVAWYVSPGLATQQYSIRVKNFSSDDLVDLEVQIADVTVFVGQLQAGAKIQRQGFTTRPAGPASVTWTDETGNAISVSGASTGGPPRTFDGGVLVVNIMSPYDVHTYFLASP